MERCKSVIDADFDFSKTSKSEDEWNFQFCIGYMIGITHSFDGNCHDVTSMDVWKENASARTVIFQKVYAADNEDPDASIQAFMNWVTKNPDKWDKDAPYTTYLWLAETFPCD